jgi:hypothetical protein
LGDSKYRSFPGPGFNNFDIPLLKNTHIKESLTVQVRFEFFNYSITHRFANVDRNIDRSPLFGYATSARDPRIGQVALKVLF